MKLAPTLLAAAVLLTAATGANATLVSALGGQVVNDTDLNVTWLSNANLAATNSFGLARNVDLGTIPGVNTFGGSYIYNDGKMTWGGAMKWVAAMNTANYLGYHDWRLPTTTDTGTPGCNYSYNGTDCGYNSTGSEMSHLYYNELGNKAFYNTAGVQQSGGLANTGTFSNFQTYDYWSGTEYAPNTFHAWYFITSTGNQNVRNKNINMFALAVRPGQVAAVPVPAAAWLLGSGLLGLIGVARRRLAL